MSMNPTRKLIIGAVFAFMVFFVFISLIGADDFIDSLLAVSLDTLVLLLVIALFGISMMGLSFYTVGRSLEFDLSRFQAIVLFTGINLSHNLTPFGQVGGEPIGAAIISKRTNHPYERCLAAVSTFDLINIIPAVLVFVLGGLYVAIFEPTMPHELRPYIGAFSGFIILIVGLSTAIYRHPAPVYRLLEWLVGGLNRALGYLPLIESLDTMQLDERLRGYTDAIGTASGDRRAVAVAASFSTLAFVSQGAMLWLALTAVNIELGLAVAIVIVPISLLASAVPLPGSGGGIEAVQLSLVLITTGAAFGPALTAVVLSRGIVYWLPIILGSITIAVIYRAD